MEVMGFDLGLGMNSILCWIDRSDVKAKGEAILHWISVCVCVCEEDHIHATFQTIKHMACHSDLSFPEGCTVILSNPTLYDGKNCNVQEVATVIDLYICIGPIYISVIF